MTKRRIAILFHESQRGRGLLYHVLAFAEEWSADGHEVFALFGIRQFIPADLIIVHVDLSVVPDAYLEFAARYPIALNGRVRDIRKSTFSQIQLRGDDPYDGKVIVKSDLNYAGRPELSRGFVSRNYGHGVVFHSPADYRIYDRIRDVPSTVFADPGMIVERFLPEIENGRYVTRIMQFLGNSVDCMRIVSDNPIVNGSSGKVVGLVEPHPDILSARSRMNFDYGKFDYVIHEGRAILLDVNKTVGAALPGAPPEIMAARKRRANGIYDYF